jgi:hypothetical protein
LRKLSRSRVAELVLQAANVTAERDSTRDVALHQAKVAELLGDSLRIAERRLVQVAQRGDALDQALGRERRAKYQLVAAVDSLSARVASASVVDDSADVRRAMFNVRQAPYTIAADVAIPAPPDSARMTVGIDLDSIPVDLRLGCSAARPPTAMASVRRRWML